MVKKAKEVSMNHNKGILYLIVTAVLWSTGGILLKFVFWHPIAIAGLRSAIAGFVLLAYYRKISFSFTRANVIGALAYCTLVVLFIASNKSTSAAHAILLQFTSPIWVGLLSIVVLKEYVGLKDWVTISIIFIGMIIFFFDSSESSHIFGDVLAIISGFAMAVYIICMKLSTTPPIETTIAGNIIVAIVGIPFYTQNVDSTSLMFIIILGLIQIGISYIFFTKAIKYVSALEAILIPILEPLLNPIWVMLFYGETPNMQTLIGGLLILSSIVYQAYQKNKKAFMTS